MLSVSTAKQNRINKLTRHRYRPGINPGILNLNPSKCSSRVAVNSHFKITHSSPSPNLASTDFGFSLENFVMSLLEVITKAASASNEIVASLPEYPIILNGAEILRNLKPETKDPDGNSEPGLKNPDASSLPIPVSGWQLPKTDSQLIDMVKKFYTNLKRKLKDTNNFNKDNFVGMLNQFLEKISRTVGITVGVGSADSGYSSALIEKAGFLMGRDVTGLVLDACVSFKMWDLVETLIASGYVDHSSYLNLVTSLAAEKRSDLLCLCVKHASDLGLSELLCILKYFLCPSKDAYSTMLNVRKEWESQALLGIENVRHKMLSEKKLQVAKEASILLMVAHDGFSTPELCLHYLLASPNIDEVILSTGTGKLDGKEMMSLVRYLGKWLKKYQMFPQAIPCPNASSIGLKACNWVPKLEDVVRWVGLVLDENFSSLVLNPEFHKELKSMGELVGSLAAEAKVCCTAANFIDNLKTIATSEQN